MVDKLEKIRKGELTARENIQNYLDKIEDDKYNAFISVNENAIEEAKKIDEKIENNEAGELAGLAIAVKSNISVKDQKVTCASKTLEDYEGSFDADVIKKIKQEDGIIIGMTNMDEFAAGASGEHSAYAPTKNPENPDYITGGSSSGSAAAVAANYCDIALGSDTGGSIRNPASHCGVVGIKPSYGRVSRFGLIDLSMSLDQIGPLTRNVELAAHTLKIIAGPTKYDATTVDKPVNNYTQFPAIEDFTIGISPDFKKLCTNEKLYEKVTEKAKSLAKKHDMEIKEVSLDNIDLAVATYYPIVYTEFYSSTRKFDGRKYGKKIEEAAGDEVRRRILGGKEISRAEFEGKYYRKALAAKKLIQQDLEQAFEQVDVLITPVTPRLPHKIGEEITPEEEYAYDAFTIPANLAGNCAGTVPAGKIDDLPYGIQVMAPEFKEEMMLAVMKRLER